MKKGQTTFFIVLGIMIVAMLMFVIYVRSIEQEDQYVNADSSSVKYYVENCLTKVSGEGLELIGRNGGYTDISTLSHVIETSEFSTAYGYYTRAIYPSLSEVSDNLADYVDENILLCIDDFKVFKSQGFDIDYKDPKSKVMFTDNNVIIKTEFPVTVKKDSIVTLNDFNTNIGVRFAILHDIVSNVMQGPLPYIDLSYLGDIDVDTYILNYDSSQVYVIIDQKSRLLSKPYMLMFGVK